MQMEEKRTTLEAASSDCTKAKNALIDPFDGPCNAAKSIALRSPPNLI